MIGINPSNLHEFSKEICEYYEVTGFDVIDELERVRATLRVFCEHSPITLDPIANTIDEVLLNNLVGYFQQVKAQVEHKDKPQKTKDKEQK